MSPNTIRLHRVLRAAPEKIFRAFSDAAAMAKWLPPHGFTCTVHQFDFRIGGTYRMSFTNFTTQKSHSFGGVYREIIPGVRLVYSNKFEDPDMPGEMATTITLNAAVCGAELQVEQSGVPAMIPPEMCYLGWQESLDQLKALVEPEVKE